MNGPLQASVVIPTHNRPQAVRESLVHLASQTLDPAAFEVIVVDDGSTDCAANGSAGDYNAVLASTWPFEVRLIRQPNSGAASARNAGAGLARGRILVFLDDDITLESNTLALLIGISMAKNHAIVLGTLVSNPPTPSTPFATYILVREQSTLAKSKAEAADGLVMVSFTQCLTGLLAVNRDDFLTLGQFQDPTGGWPSWDDVDFGYRADRAGYYLVRHVEARAIHHDQSLGDVLAAGERWRRAARSAVRLFERYPELFVQMPMFRDMGPIDWRHDPPLMVARRLIRRLSASAPARWALVKLIRRLEAWAPESPMLGRLYRWTLGACVCWGYREGLGMGRGLTATLIKYPE